MLPHIQSYGHFDMNSFAFPSLSFCPISYCIDLRFRNLFPTILQLLLDFFTRFVRFDYFRIVFICIGYFLLLLLLLVFLSLFMWLSLVNIHLSNTHWKKRKWSGASGVLCAQNENISCICTLTFRCDTIKWNTKKKHTKTSTRDTNGLLENAYDNVCH